MRDIGLALRQRTFVRLAGEIVQYRYNKTLGIVKGIWDSRTITNPSKRAKLHFDKGFSAVVIQNAHSAVIESRSIPSLKPGEILVRVAYAGVCRSDVEQFEGRSGGHRGAGMFPVVPGREFSGTIVSLGDKVTSLKEGDRVAVLPVQGCGTCAACTQDRAASCQDRRELGSFGVDGGFAEYCVTRARYALKVPDGLTLREAALTQPAAAVIKGLRRLGSDPSIGELRRCAVVGADAIGYLATKILLLRGHHVVAFDTEASQLKELKAATETRRELDGLDCFDLIAETTGDQRVLTTVLQQSRRGAALLLLSSSYGHATISVEQVTAYDKTIVGTVSCGREDFIEALAILPKLELKPLLQHVFPIEEFATAWSVVHASSSPKVLLHVDPGAV
jgi:D-arabinose 1-dehydrogenase-like Zn-dependent alcohol dehydrogenase